MKLITRLLTLCLFYPRLLRDIASRISAVAVAISFSFFLSPSQSQTPFPDWPQRNVRFIVPFSAGSGTDTAARILSDRLAAKWARPVIVDNRPGGDNLIAINAFLSANDDHVLLFSSSAAFLAHPYVHAKLTYDFDRDLAPIANVADTVLVAAVPASLHIREISQLVDQAKTAPDRFNFAGAAGLPEMAVDAFLRLQALKSVKVPYRDVVGAVRDLAENRIQFLLTSFAVVRPFADAGKVRILAAGSRERSPMLKGVPSIPESGFAALSAETSVALYGLRETPFALRKRIAADIIDLVSDAKIAEQIQSTGQDPRPLGPDELAAALVRQKEGAAMLAKVLGLHRND